MSIDRRGPRLLSGDETGSVAIEFAMLAPVLMIAILGIIGIATRGVSAASARDIADRAVRCISVAASICRSEENVRQAIAEAAPMAASAVTLSFQTAECGVMTMALERRRIPFLSEFSDAAASRCAG